MDNVKNRWCQTLLKIDTLEFSPEPSGLKLLILFCFALSKLTFAQTSHAVLIVFRASASFQKGAEKADLYINIGKLTSKVLKVHCNYYIFGIFDKTEDEKKKTEKSGGTWNVTFLSS